MAYPQHRHVESNDDPAARTRSIGRGYDTGGSVAQMQAELAQRLSSERPREPLTSASRPDERIVGRFSSASGYVALLAGYAAAGILIAIAL